MKPRDVPLLALSDFKSRSDIKYSRNVINLLMIYLIGMIKPMAYSFSDLLIRIIFYFIVVLTLSGLTLAFLKVPKKSFLQKFTLFISPFTIIFFTLWIISSLFPDTNLKDYLLSASTIILPIVWFLISFGIILYGVITIVTRHTFVNLPIPVSTRGIYAIFFGIIFVIAGVMMGLTEFIFILFVGCDKHIDWLCSLGTIVDSIFGLLGQWLSILVKPLQFLGLMKNY